MMQIKIYLFLVECSLFYIQYNFVIVKAFIGMNVRIANQDEFSFIVSFTRINHNNQQPETDHLCSGSLVSQKDILTSSHGFEQVQLESFEIIAGSIDLRYGRKYYPAWWINYSQWSVLRNFVIEEEETDIAMIRLTKAVWHEIIPVVLLPLPCTAVYGKNITCAGWGKTHLNEFCRYQRVADLTIISKTECENKMGALLGRDGYLPEPVLCSIADPIILSTPGDSGAPVLYMGLLVAVHKGIGPDTLPMMHPQKLNIHVSIYAFMNFIGDIMNFN